MELERVMQTLRAEADPEAARAQQHRFGIPADGVLGLPMRRMLEIGKQLAPSHDLAQALWGSGVYEARTVAALVDEPEKVAVEQMQAWAADFDSWAIVDTVCFRLFDRVGPRWDVVGDWCVAEPLFVKRAGYALLWALALHDRTAPDASFARLLPVLGEQIDERKLVAQAQTMALRAVVKQRPALRDAVADLVQTLHERGGAARRVAAPILKELRGAAPG
ncbi:DNA alkylation repair protein [Pseudactinotalea terrae]|uniref:DNA alkylation repair protein n=1 Tax=Pseudactinotalea terrae TaxID=1743262 RepID=UPI001F4F5448|nr:DNA alkylation repair protein [Pseudactinotalea terrae]